MQFKNNEYIFWRQTLVLLCILDHVCAAFLDVGTGAQVSKGVAKQATSRRLLLYTEGLFSLCLCRKHQQDGELDTLPGFINVNCDCCMFSDNPLQFK